MELEEIKKIVKDKVEGKWIPEHNEFGHYYRSKRSKRIIPSVTTQNISAKPHLLRWASRLTIETFRDNPELFQNYVAREKELERLGRPKGEINEFLIEAQKSFVEAKEDAATVGTNAHNLVERYINEWISNGVPPEDIRKIATAEEDRDYRAIAAARSAESVLKQYPIQPIASELLVGSYKYNMAGTLDFLCYNTETKQVELWDWKSSNNVDDDYARQTASYRRLLLDMVRNKFDIPVIRILKLDKWSDRFKPYLVANPDEAFKAQLANNRIYQWQTNGKMKLLVDKNRIRL
jgi:hypothetical protein